MRPVRCNHVHDIHLDFQTDPIWLHAVWDRGLHHICVLSHMSQAILFCSWMCTLQTPFWQVSNALCKQTGCREVAAQQLHTALMLKWALRWPTEDLIFSYPIIKSANLAIYQHVRIWHSPHKVVETQTYVQLPRASWFAAVENAKLPLDTCSCVLCIDQHACDH